MTEAKQHYKKGLEFFGDGKHAQAITEYKTALDIEPRWTDAMHALAMAHLQNGEVDEAIRVGKEIVELDPNDAFAHTSLSIFYQRKDMIEEAEKEAAKARMISWKEELKKNPNAPPPGPAGGMDPIQ